MSLGGSHTNAFLRSVLHKYHTDVPELQVDGCNRIDRERIFQCPDLKRAADQGMTFTILSHVVEETWPSLPEIVQRSLNTRAFESQSEVELSAWLQPIRMTHTTSSSSSSSPSSS